MTQSIERTFPFKSTETTLMNGDASVCIYADAPDGSIIMTTYTVPSADIDEVNIDAIGARRRGALEELTRLYENARNAAEILADADAALVPSVDTDGNRAE